MYKKGVLNKEHVFKEKTTTHLLVAKPWRQVKAVTNP